MPAMRAQASAIYVGIIIIVTSLGPVFVSVRNNIIVEFRGSLGGGGGLLLTNTVVKERIENKE